jgi:hypothetical protein
MLSHMYGTENSPRGDGLEFSIKTIEWRKLLQPIRFAVVWPSSKTASEKHTTSLKRRSREDFPREINRLIEE